MCLLCDEALLAKLIKLVISQTSMCNGTFNDICTVKDTVLNEIKVKTKTCAHTSKLQPEYNKEVAHTLNRVAVNS